MIGTPHPTESSRASRRLAAILAADVVGYSRLMGLDEEGTLARLKALRRDVIDPIIATHCGRTVKLMGDGVLVEFASAVDAVRCAVETQRAVASSQDDVPADRRLSFRIGINLGDILLEGDDIYGDGVNVAARLESLAEPGGICVSSNIFEQVNKKLDVGFVDLGEQTVKNIAQPIRVYGVEFPGAPAYAGGSRLGRAKARRGWLWPTAAAVGIALAGLLAWQLALAPRDSMEDRTSGSPAPGLARTMKPVVAVLPFTNQSTSAPRDYFSDGLAEDIIAALGRFPDLAVIARNSSFALREEAGNIRDAVQDLGARYLVEGSVRRSGDRVRVAVQLTDVEQGLHRWSERFDGEMKDIFALQDEITRGIVGALAVRLGRLEVQRTLAKPTQSLEAYDLVLRGRHAAQQITRPRNYEARTFFRRALELDPDYPAALVGLGRTYITGALVGWEEDPVGAIDTAERLARKAIALRDDEASAHALLGHVYLMRADHDRAIVELDRAIELNPNDAESYARRGQVLVWSSRVDEGIESFERALRFDPAMNHVDLVALGYGYYLKGRYDDAARIFERGAAAITDNAFVHIGLAITYAQMGRNEDAARVAETAQRMHPFFDAAGFGSVLPNPEHRRHLADGLEKAGLN